MVVNVMVKKEMSTESSESVSYFVLNRAKQNEHIKALVKDSLYNSISQACIKIVHTPYRLVQLYLITLILVVASTCAYLVIASILTYLSFDVTTTTRHYYETPTLFPKVTICSANIFTTRESLEFLHEINRKHGPPLFFSSSSNLSFDEKQDAYKKINTKGVYLMNAKSTSISTRKSLGKRLSDILLSCTFNEQERCDEADFTWRFDRDFGNCWTFNESPRGRAPRNSSIAGTFNGLHLEMYVNFYEGLSEFNSYVNNGMGAIVRVENNTYETDQTYYLTRVAAGMSTDVSVERHFKFYLPKPYSNCDANFELTDLYRLIDDSEYNYDQQSCFVQCNAFVLFL